MRHDSEDSTLLSEEDRTALRELVEEFEDLFEPSASQKLNALTEYLRALI